MDANIKNLWKVKCKNCKKEYELLIGNVAGLRKQYCLHCGNVGTLILEVDPVINPKSGAYGDV
ncbi:hypothetical protein A2Z67_04795 [Candidatus Woesebacteria bacterium RBG_13_36_22]|uniref:Uncharacterized protein n=1 Tax=Candidatus Woesebacteria bacterium RBG_13_36_22 TaxID=1802478 RepID=A0A1F7X4D8_9BACT|nr:MAG: hypothetical protein A2Z67_04795 [Candidatus Woesebacteria bacterium RBG_13_36_22]